MIVIPSAFNNCQVVKTAINGVMTKISYDGIVAACSLRAVPSEDKMPRSRIEALELVRDDIAESFDDIEIFGLPE